MTPLGDSNRRCHPLCLSTRTPSTRSKFNRSEYTWNYDDIWLFDIEESYDFLGDATKVCGFSLVFDPASSVYCIAYRAMQETNATVIISSSPDPIIGEMRMAPAPVRARLPRQQSRC